MYIDGDELVKIVRASTGWTSERLCVAIRIYLRCTGSVAALLQ